MKGPGFQKHWTFEAKDQIYKLNTTEQYTCRLIYHTWIQWDVLVSKTIIFPTMRAFLLTLTGQGYLIFDKKHIRKNLWTTTTYLRRDV